MKLSFVQPSFAAKVFAISSAITSMIFIVLVRVLLGGILGVGETITGAGETAANLGLGLALSYTLAVAVPTMFCVGWVSGYLTAMALNLLSSSLTVFRVPENAFRLEKY